ncbi:MAG: DEAD/DEAH box helicase [Verrucomicrobiota bacterium]
MTATIESFEQLPLVPELHRALEDLHYSTPSPVQARSIPPLLDGKDVVGCAQTGTGKTAAFALPILHHLAMHPDHPVANCARALVLTPTRELAVQVGDSFSRYGRHLRTKVCLVYGGVSQVPQVKKMRRGVDILVATPGRLLDLMDQGHVSLERVEFLVLDEVDRMLDMGFVHDVKRIAGELPENRQTALFTATLDGPVRRVAESFVTKPVQVRIDPGKPVVERIVQTVCHVRPENKAPLLEFLLTDKYGEARQGRTLVFSRTKHGAARLAKRLSIAGIESDAIHGNRTQAARQKALERFRSGAVPVLVATDVAARGIDVTAVAMVINFDLPSDADTYVHRVGRTARAEASGRAVSFCDGDTLKDLQQIERRIGTRIQLDREHPFHDPGLSRRTQSKERRTQSEKTRRWSEKSGPRSQRKGTTRRVASKPHSKPGAGRGPTPRNLRTRKRDKR